MEKLRAYLNAMSTRDQAQFAWDCGTTIGYLRRRISDKGRISLELASEIERVSRGQLRVEDLRDDLNIEHLRANARRRHRAA